MNQRELFKAKDQDLVTSMAAMKRAAAMARKVAVQTDTAIVVVQGKKIVRVTADDLRAGLGNPQITQISADSGQQRNLCESVKSADKKS